MYHVLFLNEGECQSPIYFLQKLSLISAPVTQYPEISLTSYINYLKNIVSKAVNQTDKIACRFQDFFFNLIKKLIRNYFFYLLQFSSVDILRQYFDMKKKAPFKKEF